MSLISDAMTSVKAYLYERTVSPLLGSLIVSWCGWNYKFLLMLFSELTYHEKLIYIQLLYDTDYEKYYQGIVFPIITSLLYLFAFTYPSEWVYRFSLERQKVLNDLKNEKQQVTLLTIEQSKAIRKQLAEAENQFEEQIDRKDRAIELRDIEIEKLNEQLNKQMSAEQPNSTELVDLSLEEVIGDWIEVGKVDKPETSDEYFASIIISIYDKGGSFHEVDLFSQYDNETKVRYYVDELISRKYITRKSNGTLVINHQVKGVMVENM